MARSSRVGRSFAHGIALCVLMLLALTGCGGDSGGSEDRPPPSSTGAATVNWQPPTANVDGSTLVDLAGFRIFYGTNRNALERTVELPNPGLTSYMIEDLTAGTWYFGVKVYTSAGAESAMSQLASKEIE